MFSSTADYRNEVEGGGFPLAHRMLGRRRMESARRRVRHKCRIPNCPHARPALDFKKVVDLNAALVLLTRQRAEKHVWRGSRGPDQRARWNISSITERYAIPVGTGHSTVRANVHSACRELLPSVNTELRTQFGQNDCAWVHNNNAHHFGVDLGVELKRIPH